MPEARVERASDQSLEQENNASAFGRGKFSASSTGSAPA